jgi:hypothetical protein
MIHNKRSRLVFVVMMIVALALTAVPMTPVYAATCTSQATGDWNAAGTWSGCGGGVPQNGDDVVIAAGHTVTLNITPVTINSLTVSGTFNMNTANNTPRTMTVSGDLTVNVGGTLTLNDAPGNSAHTLSIGGNFTNNGTFTTANNNDTINVTFNGSTAQTIGGANATTFNNLTLNNTNGLTLNTNATVNGVLTFTNGKITTGANTLILPTTATVSGAGTSRYVNGNVRRAFTAGSLTFNFPIGDASLYDPLSLTFAGISTGGNVTASVTGADCSAIGSSDIDSTKSVNHCWTLTNGGVVFTSYGATFNYGNGSDVDASTPANFIAQRYNGTTWSTLTLSGTPTGSSTTVTGVTSMSDFAIGESKVTPTLSVTNPSVTYNGSPQTATVVGSVAGTVSDIKYDGSTTIPANAGTYAVTADFAPDDPVHYKHLNDASAGNFMINAKALDITADNQSKTYGTSFTFTGTEFSTGTGQLVNGDTVDSVTLTSAGAAGTATVAGSPYAITPSAAAGAGLGNYTISYVNGELTVDPAALTITADDRSKSYGDTVTFAGTEFTTTGLVNGDAVTSVTLTSAGAAASASVAGSPYAIVPSAAVGAGLGNYTISYVNGELTVDPAALTVTGITADDKPYDGNTTATLNTGSAVLVDVVGSDDVTLNVGSAAGTFASANVGTWTVTISGLTLGGADAGNYTLTQPSTTASITGATLTVDGITAQNKVYDGTTAATIITDNAVLVGVVSGDDVQLVTTSAVGTFTDKNVGAGKTVTVSGLTLTGADAGKYSLTQPTTTADITPLAITVTADSGQSKVYGAADPAFTYTHDPLVGSDGFSGALSRVAGENTGAYAITQGTLTAGSNYTINFVSANFTITPADTSTSLASSANPSVVGTSVTFTATVAPSAATGTVQFYADGVALGSAAAVSGGTTSVNTAALIGGTHVITATYGGDSNFNASTSEPLLQEVAVLTEPSYDVYLPVILRNN